MKNKAKKLETLYLTAILILSINNVIYAAQPPELVAKALLLFGDATGWLIPLIIAATVLMVAFFFFQKTMSDDQAQSAELNKKIKTTIVAGVIGVASSGLVNFILSYFQ